MGTIEVITINGKPIQELIDALEKGIRQIVKDANKYRHPIDDAILYQKKLMDLERKELEEKCMGYYKANECTLRIFT